MAVANILFTLLAIVASATGETGIDGWLRYAPLDLSLYGPSIERLPKTIIALNQTATSPVGTAVTELQHGFQSMFGKYCGLSASSESAQPAAITIGSLAQYQALFGNISVPNNLTDDGYSLEIRDSNVNIIGSNERGALYGTFKYLSMLAQGNFSVVSFTSNPSAPIRWVNQWDNLQGGGTHGSVERGCMREHSHPISCI